MVTQSPLPESVLKDPQQPRVGVEEPRSVAMSEDQKYSFLCRKPVRITLYSLLGAFALFILSWGMLPSLLDPTFEQHIQDKEVIAGMTRDQAIQAWGSPYQMNVTYTDKGIRREEWVYEDWIDAGSVRHRYLYFEEGILVGGWYYK